MTVLGLDFETRSTIELRKSGVYRYAEDSTTDVWCLAFAFDDFAPFLWHPDLPVPYEIRMAAEDPSAEFRAWNAQFERTIWREIMVKRYGFPEIPLDRWYCTAAEGAAMALPRALGQCAAVLGVEEQKSNEGHRLMMQMAKPRSKPGQPLVWWDDKGRRERLYAYCKQDVKTEHSIYKAVRRLTHQERQVYLLDQTINDRGVMLDAPLARAAKRIAVRGIDQANIDIRKVTNGSVMAVTQTGRIVKWLNEQDRLLELDSVRKSVVRDLLESDGISDPVRQVLEIRAEAGRSSISKIDSMFKVVCADGYLRGLLLYHAARTGRWAGRLVQPHNFPRPAIKDPEQFIPEVLAGQYKAIDLFYPPVLVISWLLRTMLRATPGCRLVVGDFAQIEARVLAWLAGQEDLVQLFAEGGKVYETSAAATYGKPVEEIAKGSEERQLGKMTILGCGFQMGPKAFRKQAAEQWGMDLSEELAKAAVSGYRKQNTDIVQFWYDIEEAALDAVRKPGAVYEVQGCKLVVRGNYLWLVLPSKRPLCYAKPSLEIVEVPWGHKETVKVWSVNSMTKKWERRALYGGLLTENIVQALARDIMMGAMLRTEAAGYPNILSVHDEVVADVPEDHGSLDEFVERMQEVPDWAVGCPIAVEGYESQRYRK